VLTASYTGRVGHGVLCAACSERPARVDSAITVEPGKPPIVQSARLPPAIPIEVLMRLIGLAVVLTASLALAPFATETQPGGPG
jgi:hypothetical protein